MEENRDRVSKIVQIGSGTQEDVHTILHDTTLDVIQIIKQGKFDPNRASLNTLFYQIAKNKWLDELGRQNRRNERESPLEETHYAKSSDSPPEKFMIDQEEIEQMARALKQLSAKCQELFRMKYWEELTLREIAKQIEPEEDTKLTEDTIKKRHERCKAKLRKILGKDPRID